MKIVVSVAFLTMFTPSSSFAFSVTGGLNYNLQVLNTPPAKTAATVISVQTTPDGAETRMPLETYPVPVERGALGVTLGRIEYGVAIGGIRSYKTTIKVSVMDTALGETDCTFVFDVNVHDQAFGPLSVVAMATANDIDEREFANFTSNKRCQVFSSGLAGPTLQIFSRIQNVP
jgi:hypothetical protein